MQFYVTFSVELSADADEEEAKEWGASLVDILGPKHPYKPKVVGATLIQESIPPPEGADKVKS